MKWRIQHNKWKKKYRLQYKMGWWDAWHNWYRDKTFELTTFDSYHDAERCAQQIFPELIEDKWVTMQRYKYWRKPFD